MAEYTAQVETGDILLFLSSCISGTSQSTYYSSAAEQRSALDFLHLYICANYRKLYAATLAQEINQHNQVRIIHNLLQSPTANRQEQEWEQGLITRALRDLPVHRVYKLFAGLALARVNNRRSRATVKAYLAWRDNMLFDAVKYRRLMRLISRHWHLALAPELQLFLHSKDWKKRKFETPFLEHFRQAHYSANALKHLPLTVAEGLAPRFNLSRKAFLALMQDQMTDHEKLRLQSTAQTAKFKLDFNPEKVGLTRLLAYILSLPRAERKAGLEQLEDMIARALKRHQIPWLQIDKVALIIDNSQSSRGSRESHLRPLITALAAHFRLPALSKEYQVFWLHPPEHALLAEAKGQTSLAETLIEALAWAPSDILIVSDGAENDPAGGVHWVLETAQKAPWAQPLPRLLHLNPLISPQVYGPSSLSPHLPMLGIFEGEKIGLLWILARFARQELGVEGLKDYFWRSVHG